MNRKDRLLMISCLDLNQNGLQISDFLLKALFENIYYTKGIAMQQSIYPST